MPDTTLALEGPLAAGSPVAKRKKAAKPVKETDGYSCGRRLFTVASLAKDTRLVFCSKDALKLQATMALAAIVELLLLHLIVDESESNGVLRIARIIETTPRRVLETVLNLYPWLLACPTLLRARKRKLHMAVALVIMLALNAATWATTPLHRADYFDVSKNSSAFRFLHAGLYVLWFYALFFLPLRFHLSDGRAAHYAAAASSGKPGGKPGGSKGAGAAAGSSSSSSAVVGRGRVRQRLAVIYMTAVVGFGFLSYTLRAFGIELLPYTPGLFCVMFLLLCQDRHATLRNDATYLLLLAGYQYGIYAVPSILLQLLQGLSGASSQLLVSVALFLVLDIYSRIWKVVALHATTQANHVALLILVQFFGSLFSELVFIVLDPFDVGFFLVAAANFVRTVLSETRIIFHATNRCRSHRPSDEQESIALPEGLRSAFQGMLSEILSCIFIPLVVVVDAVLPVGKPAGLAINGASLVSITLAYLFVMCSQLCAHLLSWYLLKTEAVDFLMRRKARLALRKVEMRKLAVAKPHKDVEAGAAEDSGAADGSDGHAHDDSSGDDDSSGSRAAHLHPHDKLPSLDSIPHHSDEAGHRQRVLEGLLRTLHSGIRAGIAHDWKKHGFYISCCAAYAVMTATAFTSGLRSGIAA